METETYRCQGHTTNTLYIRLERFKHYRRHLKVGPLYVHAASRCLSICAENMDLAVSLAKFRSA